MENLFYNAEKSSKTTWPEGMKHVKDLNAGPSHLANDRDSFLRAKAKAASEDSGHNEKVLG